MKCSEYNINPEEEMRANIGKRIEEGRKGKRMDVKDISKPKLKLSLESKRSFTRY